MNYSIKIDKVTFLFFAFYIILPKYFALEISQEFPLITFSRLLLMLFCVQFILRKKGIIRTSILKKYKKIRNNIKWYFIILIFVNIFFIFSIPKDAINKLLSIFMEELAIIWIISQTINTKEKVIQCLEIILYSSAVIAIFSIIGLLFGENYFYYLNTVNREMLMSNMSRMGLIRVEAGFGHAVYYGLYCTVMIPIGMYFFENYRVKRLNYIICILLNIFALILTNSRGTLLSAILLIFIMILKKKQKQIKKYLKISIFSISVFAVTSMFIKQVSNFLINIFRSIFYEILPSLGEIDNYGINIGGWQSRFAQFTSISWVLKKSPIFGLGPDAQTRGVLSYFWLNNWQVIETYDNGYLKIYFEYGLFGIIAFFLLFIGIYKLLNKTIISKSDDILGMFKFSFLAYFLGMLSVTGVDKLFWVLVGLLISYVNVESNMNSKI